MVGWIDSLVGISPTKSHTSGDDLDTIHIGSRCTSKYPTIKIVQSST